MEYFRVGMDARDVVTAANMNEIVDAVNWTKSNRTWIAGGSAGRGDTDTGIIRVKLDSDMSQFSAVVLGDAVLTADNCDTFATEVPTMEGKAAGSSYSDEPFAILATPGEKDGIAKAVISGCTPAKVTIKDSSHKYAKPTAGSSSGALETAATGTARILWKAGDEKEQWCFLQLGSGGAGGDWDGSFKLSYDSESKKVKVGEGFVSANGEWKACSEQSVDAEDGYICVHMELDDGGSWKDPEVKIAKPDAQNYPVGKCAVKTTGEGDSQQKSVTLTSYHVEVAVIIVAAQCPIAAE